MIEKNLFIEKTFQLISCSLIWAIFSSSSSVAMDNEDFKLLQLHKNGNLQATYLLVEKSLEANDLRTAVKYLSPIAEKGNEEALDWLREIENDDYEEVRMSVEEIGAPKEEKNIPTNLQKTFKNLKLIM